MECSRKEEINCAINLIQDICVTTNISLIVKKYKGVNLIAIHDNVENKNYGIALDTEKEGK